MGKLIEDFFFSFFLGEKIDDLKCVFLQLSLYFKLINLLSIYVFKVLKLLSYSNGVRKKNRRSYSRHKSLTFARSKKVISRPPKIFFWKY